jgi:Bacteriophage lambda head decoration protein D
MTTNYGDNPQQPTFVSDAFIPDQLIAGDLKLVTDKVTITGGAALKRGSVLGQVTIGAAGAPTAKGGNTGNGHLSAVALGSRAKVGTYTIRFRGAALYDVLDPHGLELAQGIAAGAYGSDPADPEITFTFTAGSVAMVAGDEISIAVVAGSGSYKLAASASTDGSQNPVAILADDADASGGDVSAGIYLHGEFNANALTLGTGITAAAAKAALQPFGIFIKSTVSAADPA